jgi:sugar phosphate isomerase/epimerase
MSSWVTKYFEDVLRIAQGLSFQAVEIDCDEKPIPATQTSRSKLKETLSTYGLKIFYHSPFWDQAIGSTNEAIRRNTFNTLQMYLDFLQDLEGNYLVIHAGVSDTECPEKNVVEDLQKLVDIAQSKHITLCVENLRFGLSSDPHRLRQLAEDSGSRIVFDLGHANSCSWIESEKRSSKDFLRIIERKVVGAHVYLKEEGGRHHPFREIDEVKETLDELININSVVWWTIELHSIEDVIKQKLMLDSYFKSKISMRPVQ